MLLFITVEGDIHTHMFFKIGPLKNFTIFTGKYLCWNNFIKKRPKHSCFLLNNAKSLRTAFFIEHLQ